MAGDRNGDGSLRLMVHKSSAGTGPDRGALIPSFDPRDMGISHEYVRRTSIPGRGNCTENGPEVEQKEMKYLRMNQGADVM